MGKQKGLAGWSWHIEFLHLDENDSRRDKRRCKYYIRDGKCYLDGTKCMGSSHCMSYEEVVEYFGESTIKAHREPLLPSKVPCSIPFDYIETKFKKVGLPIRYEDNKLTLLIDGEEVRFLYPDAFEKGFLIKTPEIEECIKRDLRESKKQSKS